MKKDNAWIISENQTLQILDLLEFYICIYISGHYCGTVFFGAAAFIAGISGKSFLVLYAHRDNIGERKIPIAMFLIGSLIALASAATIVLLSSSEQTQDRRWIVLGCAALLVLRSMLTYDAVFREEGNPKRLMLRLGAAELLALLPLTLLLGLTNGWGFALRVLALTFVHPVVVAVWLLRAPQGRLLEPAHYATGEAASYKLFNALNLCSNIAFYLSIMAYTGMLEYMPVGGDLLLPVVIWIALMLIIALILGRAFRNGLATNMEKNSLFLIGGYVWLFARLRLNDSYEMMNPSMAWVWSLVQAAGLAVMLLLTSYMQEDMKLVLELSDEEEKASVNTRQFLAQHTAFMVAGLVIVVAVYGVNLSFQLGWISAGDSGTRQALMWILNVLPMGFVLLSMFFAIVQPLNRDIVRKLRLYREQKLSRTIIPEFESKLRRLLVKRYRKRIGVKIVMFLMKPFCFHRVYGAKNVHLGDGPVVFVANHREIYGPIIVNLYLPFTFRPWIEYKMLDRNEIYEYLWTFTFSKVKPVFAARAAMNAIVPIVMWALNSVEPIPVYRGTLREIIKTMELSVTAMQEQDNVLIFPEDPSKSGGRYALSGVSPFYTGFVSLAKYYYRKTKKALTFYPVYCDPRGRTITFGEGVTYRPGGENESERVSERLMDAMNEMADAQKKRREPSGR